MSKNTLSSITLAIAVILILGGLININRPVFEPDLWKAISGFCLGLVFAVITWRLRVGVRREQEAAARAAVEKKAEEEARRLQRDQEEARRKAEADTFRRETFPVAGVTFQNEDKTDRQKILREIALNEDGFCDVWFEEDEELGDESGIRVMTELGCVGFVRRSDKQKIRRFFGRMTQSRCLSVERFENDDGQKIYRADVVFTMKKGDPDQQWYFDDLPES